MPLSAFALAVVAQQPRFEHLTPVPFTQVRISDKFWAPRQEINRRISLPHSLKMLEESGTIGNFELAAKGARTGFKGFVFMDSDAYKALEAISFSLATHPDKELEKQVDAVIAKIAAAQMPDGYINTYYEINAPDKRFTNLRDNHELYCMGHLIEAGVAHHRATGKKTLLNVAIKAADKIDSVFGDGRRMGYPGHPELELALVKLANETGDQRYFRLAEFFVNNRGSKFFATEHNTPLDRYDGTYWQDQVPIRDQQTMVGHAVRAGYLLSGVVDVMAQSKDPGLVAMIDRVWNSATQKRMFVTGGIGASGSNEGFTTDYDLPNFTAYQETCASVSMAMWNQRLAALYGDSKYADVAELSLYNGVLAGGSADGSKYFYVNPLASRGGHHRSGWFSCACCPPNEARTVASIGGYAYATSADALWVNLFIQGSVRAKVAGQERVVDVKTNYPWDGKATYTIQTPGKFTLRFRHPGWCVKVGVSVNGTGLGNVAEDRGYVAVTQNWKKGDAVTFWMTMPVRRIAANPRVKENLGKLALARGPLIYCLEAVDNGGRALDISIPADARIRFKEENVLGGLVTLYGTGYRRPAADWTGGLYASYAPPSPVEFRAIPYYAWDNRAPGEMQVWIPTAPEPPLARGLEGSARVSISYKSANAQPSGINDGSEPKSSGEQPSQLCHWWPHKGTEEWVQYTWPQARSVSSSRVYFFDDTGRGECRYPESWRIEYLDAGSWKPVSASAPYTVKGDSWNEVEFAPVKTTALRIVLKMKDGWAAGVRQWQVH